MSVATATVETLTAEVRVLMVGSRQVTLSVYRQLDWVPFTGIEPFGRVNDSKDSEDSHISVVGVDGSGALTRSSLPFRAKPQRWEDGVFVESARDAHKWRHDGYFKYDRQPGIEFYLRDRNGNVYTDEDGKYVYGQIEGRGFFDKVPDEYTAEERTAHEWAKLPLIVLAGLR